MTTTEIVMLSVYAIGLVLYVIIFFIQRAQIERLKSSTDQFEKFIKIFDLNKVEDYVKMHERNLELKKENWIQEFGKSMAEKMVKENVTPTLNKHLGDFKKSINDQMNELGYFVIDLLLVLPEDDVERLLKNSFPKSSELLRINLEKAKKLQREKPDEGNTE